VGLKEHDKMTRAEHLKALMINIPVEKLADLLGYDSEFCNSQCPYRHEDSCIGKCKQGRLEWLNQEIDMYERLERESND
jgi:hypothetical protein